VIRGSAEHHHGGNLATGTPFAGSDAGEAKLSNYPHICDCADCSTPRAAYEWVFS